MPLRTRKSSGFGSVFAGLFKFLGERKTKAKFPDPPVLLLGSPRSGTSISIAVLSAHPQLYCLPFESRMLTEWTTLKSGKLYPQRRYRLYRHVLFNRIPNGKRLVEKSPAHLSEIPEIEKYYGKGKAKFVHIVRDGRDVVLSTYPGSDAHPSADRWMYEVEIALKYKDWPNFYTIRYEDLIKNFDKTIGGLCDYLELPFDNAMKDWFRNKTMSSHEGVGKVQPLFSGSIQKWKKVPDHPEVKKLNEDPRARQLLTVWGYLAG
ncbi:MAG: hypothetical protein ACI959_000102 [Limisphaerales bacterium]|jgi:hypothetical protein